MKKRILAILLCLAMVGSMLPVGAIAQGVEETVPGIQETEFVEASVPEESAPVLQAACSHEAQGWTLWEGEDSLPASGSIILTKTVALKAEQILDGTTLSICLNGNDIIAGSGKRIFQVSGGAELNICDCAGTGKLTGANVTVDGGAVYVVGAAFNMSGGNIYNNHTTAAGGGVCAGSNSVVNITGGTITGNSAKNGGAMVVQGSGNKVLVRDVTITNNTSAANGVGGGAIYVGTPDALTLSGNVQITGNLKGTATNNLYVVSTTSQSRPVIQKDLDAASRIGIGIYNTTKSNVIVSSGAAVDTVSCYIPDDSSKVIEYSAGTLALIAKPANVSAHANTEGYTAGGHGTAGWVAWYGTDILPSENAHYYLTADVNLTAPWTVGTGKTITLCLNGHSITQKTEGKRVIHINGGTLNICDCTAKMDENGEYISGKITGGKNVDGAGAGVRVENGGTFHFYDGDICANSTNNSLGGGVYVVGSSASAKSTFNMYGGSIANNQANTYGGGVATNGNATVDITGGIITGNSAARGGGISVEKTGDSVRLENVTITANTAGESDRGGAGIYVGVKDSVIVSGIVNITGNHMGTADSNVTVGYDRCIIEYELDSSSTIGISAYGGTSVAKDSTVGTVGCYTSDDSTKVVQYRDGVLYLLDKPAGGSEHANTAGYDHCHGSDVTWLAWNYTDRLPTSSGHYYLVKDVELTAVWNAGDSKDITLCLNGHNITQLSEGLRVIRVGSSTVNICDCTAHVDENGIYISGKITGGNTDASDDKGNAGAMMLTNGGTFRLYDGNITGNHTDGNGVIVAQNGFTFEMRGGRICGNTAGGTQGGAGVLVTGGAAFNLIDGQICCNEAAANGGGIYLNNGTVRMTSGKITGNTAKNGGAVMIAAKGTFYMEGGSIEENTASVDGGGVYVYGTFNMKSGKITGNHADNSAGGGIAAGSGAKANISGGEISGNFAKNGGGMILQGTDPVVVLKDVSITENEAASNGAGIYVLYKVGDETLKHVTLGGKVEITGNTVNNTASNLLLGKDQVLYHDGLDSESQIGAGTVGQIPKQFVCAGGSEENLSCYVSDILGRTFELRDAEIWMIVHPDAVHQSHQPDECGHKDVQWTEWASQTSLPTAEGHYYLICDVALSKIWNAGDDKEITICLNGHNITQTVEGLRVIRVGSSTVNICDCTAHVDENGIYISGKITGGNTDASDETGNAGAMMLTNGGTVRLYGGNITGNKTEGNGVIVVQRGSSFEMHGGRIESNTAGKQGGAVFLSGSTMEMTGGEILGNTSESYGGAVYNIGGSFELSGGVIGENTSVTGGGGGIYMKSSDADAIVTISGGKIRGNVSKLDGSGVRMDSGKFMMTGGEVTGNGSEEGAAGGLRLGGGVAAISGGKISGNIGGNAAGVLANCDLTMTGGEISGNIGTGSGAGVYVSGSTFYLSGGKILNNQAGGKGAGVFLSQSALEMSGGWILGNTASGHGGGVATLGGTVRMTDGLIKDNVSGGGGGGIYTESRVTDGSVTAETVLELSGGKIYGNTSKLMGGGIRMDNGKLNISGVEIAENKAESDVGGVCAQNATVTITDGRIVKNTAGNAAGFYANSCDVTMSGGLISTNIGGGNGAGAYFANSAFKFSGGYIRFNESTGNGGGVFLSQSTMEMTGGEIHGNRGGMGGGIYNLGGSLTVKGGVIKNNEAYKVGGGGIYSVSRFAEDKVTVTAEASVSIAGGEVSGNKSKSDGAGVRVDSGKFQMSDGLITGNKSGEASAGGLRLANVTGAVISGGTITKNSGNNAAGIYVTKGDLTITGGEISHNAAIGSGAGVLASSADVKFSGGVIEENSAKGDGAGLYISNGKLTLCGGKIVKNRAEKVCGGVLATKNSRIYFTSGSITGNTAKASSGGVMVQGGSTMQMSGGTVSNNIAVNYGGGIYVNKTSSLSFSGGTISGNAARKSGGGIYVGKDAKATIAGGTITANDATAQGGGMTIVGDTTISGGTISKNTAKKEGAGIYISNATVKFSGGTVEENVTEYNGGGICVRGETGLLEMSGDAKVLNNECAESGGGILVQGNGKLVMHSGEILGNLAPNGGGGIRLHNCAAEIYGGKINENVSYGAGAGIYTNLSLIIKDAEVCDNKIINEANIATRSSAAIRTYNESTLLMENVKVTGNSCDGRAGAIEIAYNVDATIKNCTFENNTATERGGTFSVYREGQLYMRECTISGGSTGGNGGAFSLDPYGEIELTDCTISDNTADQGGVTYVGTKGSAAFHGCTVKNNVAKSHGSVIWANGSVMLDDTVITGNEDKRGGAAVYLNNEGEDGESYLPGVYEIKGNTTVYDNAGGDLVLVNNAFLNIHGDGLGDDSKIQVKLQDADITRWVIGPYNYQVSGDGFLLTKGEQSLAEAYMGDGESASDEEVPDTQQEETTQRNLPLIISGGAAVVLLAVILILVAVLRKKKHTRTSK